MSSFETILALAQSEGGDDGFWQRLKENLGWVELGEILGTILLAVIIGWIFKRYVLVRIQKLAAQTDTDVDDRLVHFVSRFYKGIIAFVVLLIVLNLLNVEITPLLAGAGIVGIGVAYAARDVIGNFLAGVVLMVDKPLKVGDRIQIERIGKLWGSWGDVVDVGLRTTTVRNTDGVYVSYPNAYLSESVINNFTPSDAPVRFRVRVLVELDTDLDAALATLLEIAAADDTVLADPAPSSVVRSVFNEEGGHMHLGALLELRCFVNQIRVRTRLRSKLLIDIQKAFGERGIRFARPHVTIQGNAPSPSPVP